ncbi:MAG: hypothetical protein AAGL17_15360, partial [Cyanobacteria bacterium J06576_12]
MPRIQISTLPKAKSQYTNYMNQMLYLVVPLLIVGGLAAVTIKPQSGTTQVAQTSGAFDITDQIGVFEGQDRNAFEDQSSDVFEPAGDPAFAGLGNGWDDFLGRMFENQVYGSPFGPVFWAFEASLLGYQTGNAILFGMSNQYLAQGYDVTEARNLLSDSNASLIEAQAAMNSLEVIVRNWIDLNNRFIPSDSDERIFLQQANAEKDEAWRLMFEALTLSNLARARMDEAVIFDETLYDDIDPNSLFDVESEFFNEELLPTDFTEGVIRAISEFSVGDIATSDPSEAE